MSTPQPGRCGDPGPGTAHCTDYPYHSYSHYDSSDDTSWNDAMWEQFDLLPHECDDLKCMSTLDTELIMRGWTQERIDALPEWQRRMFNEVRQRMERQ